MSNEWNSGDGIVRCRLSLRGDFEVLIGSSAECQVRVPDLPGVSQEHAALRRAGDRLFIRDLRSEGGTQVNGRRLCPGRWTEIGPCDQVTVADVVVRLSRELFTGRERLALETSPLTYVLPRAQRALCSGVHLRARPGTLTAVLGPCGSGKTTLLNLLSGSLRPTQGHVLLGRRYDVHADRERVRELLGSVPQGDLMFPELTLRQSLECRLRLRFPDMAPSMRSRAIRETCLRLGFEESRLDELLDTRISSADANSGLSGGERKRANIALEVVTQPLVLLLDEPTSGLASTEAEQVVRLLHGLARSDDLTIILTVHQPSRDVFALFDDLLVLSPDGTPAYYGVARDATAHFEALTGIECGARNPAEHLLWVSSEMRGGVRSAPCDPTGLRDLHGPLPGSAAPRGDRDSGGRGRAAGLGRTLHQGLVLFQRNLQVLWADKASLALALGQVPLIASLMILAFQRFALDVRRDDHFARTGHLFSSTADPLVRAGRTLLVDRLWNDAEAMARSETRLVSERHACKRGAIYFLLAAASIWFGLIGACKEVVGEWQVLKRESRSGVRLSSYLGAKGATMALLVGVQTGLLAGCVAPVLLEASWGSTVLLWTALWVAGAAAAALGILVSCAARTPRFALTAVPLLLVPQLLLGGLLRSRTDLEHAGPALGALSDLTLQRWAFEGSLAADAYARGGVLQQVLQDQLDTNHPYAELSILRFCDVPIRSVFFPSRSPGAAGEPLAFLGIGAGLFLGAAYAVLRWRLAEGSGARRKEVMR